MGDQLACREDDFLSSRVSWDKYMETSRNALWSIGMAGYRSMQNTAHDRSYGAYVSVSLIFFSFRGE